MHGMTSVSHSVHLHGNDQVPLCLHDNQEVCGYNYNCAGACDMTVAAAASQSLLYPASAEASCLISVVGHCGASRVLSAH